MANNWHSQLPRCGGSYGHIDWRLQPVTCNRAIPMHSLAQDLALARAPAGLSLPLIHVFVRMEIAAARCRTGSLEPPEPRLRTASCSGITHTPSSHRQGALPAQRTLAQIAHCPFRVTTVANPHRYTVVQDLERSTSPLSKTFQSERALKQNFAERCITSSTMSIMERSTLGSGNTAADKALWRLEH